MSIIQDGPARAGLIARIKNILLTPNSEWDVIDVEPATTQSLFTGYIMLLAAIGPVCNVIGSLVFGHGILGITYRPSPLWAVVGAVVSYVVSLGACFVMSIIISELAPTFGGQKDRVQALKVVAYSGTASWLCGLFSLVPMLSLLAIVGLYSIYLFYIGLPKLMKTAADKALPYTAVVAVIAVVVFFVIGLVTAPLMMMGAGAGALATGGLGASGHLSGKLNVPGGSVDLSQIEAASKQMAAAGAAAQAASASGQAAPAANAVVSGDKLQALLPDSLPGGFARKDIESSSGGLGGMQISTAKASYDKGDGHVNLTVTDMGPMGALAGAVNVNSSKTTANGYEKLGVVNGHMTTEEYDRSGKSGKYSVMAGGHFMIEAEGSGISIDDLKAAVNAVGVGRVEALAKN